LKFKYKITIIVIMMLRYIYVAGPYSTPDPESNTREAIKIGDALLNLGYYPFVPHLTHFWEQLYHHKYNEWMALDFAWLSKCDALIRLPGESNGADKEIEVANKIGIPVFYGLDDFIKRHTRTIE
jgi:Domain of unknown function (DUF4406)